MESLYVFDEDVVYEIMYNDPVKKKVDRVGAVQTVVARDESTTREFPPKFIIRKIDRSIPHEKIIQSASAEGSIFYLAFTTDTSTNAKLVDMVKHLRSRPDKVAIVETIDLVGTIGVMQPINREEEHAVVDCFVHANMDALKCYYVESEEVQERRLVNEQQAAAAHYNELVRDRATRHESQIFHLRMVNNWVKTQLIETAVNFAATRPSVGSSSSSTMGWGGGKGRNTTKPEAQTVSVLDFCCGKGGDAGKWLHPQTGLHSGLTSKTKGGLVTRYVGVDIAVDSLKHFAAERLAGLPPLQRYKVTQLVEADMGVDSLTTSVLETHTWRTEENIRMLNAAAAAAGGGSGSGNTASIDAVGSSSTSSASSSSSSSSSSSKNTDKLLSHWCKQIPLHPDDQFDIASCQFAMHYMFQTEAKANHFLSQVSNHLKDGGWLIATTIDCRAFVDTLSQHICREDENAQDEILQAWIQAENSVTTNGCDGHNSNGIGDGSSNVGSSSGNGNSSTTSKRKYEEDDDDDGTTAISSKRLKPNPIDTLDSMAPSSSSSSSRRHPIVPLPLPPTHLTVNNQFGSELLRISIADEVRQQLLWDHHHYRQATATTTEEGTGAVDDVEDMKIKVEQTDGNGVHNNSNNSSVPSSAFGLKYTFELRDKAGEAAVNAPEWLVPQGPTLETLSAKHGLIIKKIQNFHDYIREFFDGKNSETLKREIGDKGILDFRGSVSEAEWKIIRLYAVIIFEKSTGSSSASSSFVPSSPEGPPPPQTFAFVPSSSEGPPPGSGLGSGQGSTRSQGLGLESTDLIPSSPDGSPPAIIPTSPDIPPPRFPLPLSSPDTPPPTYHPPSPDLPPPTSMPPPPAPLHTPTSPDLPPPDESTLHQPQSPDAPPPDMLPRNDNDDDDDEEDDEVVLRMLKLRKIAIRLAGGQDRWDMLDDDASHQLLQTAEMEFDEADD